MIEIWITCPDRKTARRIAHALIAKRLVACANILPEIESLYRWKGKVENEPEVPLVVKTRADNFDPVTDAVRKLHPYETPSIIGVTIERVTGDYLDWIYAETH
jgi:periplasmic divalent cation tolerance protein